MALRCISIWSSERERSTSTSTLMPNCSISSLSVFTAFTSEGWMLLAVFTPSSYSSTSMRTSEVSVSGYGPMSLTTLVQTEKVL